MNLFKRKLLNENIYPITDAMSREKTILVKLRECFYDKNIKKI